MANILALLLCLFILSPCNASMLLAVYNYPPLVEIKDNQPPSGLSIDLVKTLFNRAEIPYKFSFYPPRRALDKATRKSQLCTFPVDRNQQREANYRWIGPVSVSRYAFFSKSNDSIRLFTLADAKKYSIAVFSGSAIGNYLKQAGFQVHETNYVDQGLRMLDKGNVSLWVSEIHSAETLAKKYNISSIEAEIIFFTTINFMACNLNMPEDNYQKLSEELKKMYKSGDAQDILQLNL